MCTSRVSLHVVNFVGYFVEHAVRHYHVRVVLLLLDRINVGVDTGRTTS
jgi:hypothetical protein